MSAVSEEKERSECSQKFYFNSSEVKPRSERSQRYHFAVAYDREIISQWYVLTQRSKRSVIS